MNFNDYIERAKTTQNLQTDFALAELLNIKSSSLYNLKIGKTLPKPTTIIKLAQLGNIPIEQALIDLNLWLSSENPEALQAYQNIKNSLTGFSALTSISLFLCNSSFFDMLSNLYYVYLQKIKLRKINYLGVNRFVALTIF